MYRGCIHFTQQMVGWKFWRKQHESMESSCLVSLLQAGSGCVMVWRMFSWLTLGPSMPIEHHLNATAHLSIPLLLTITDHAHPLYSHSLWMDTSGSIMCHVTKHASFQAGFINMAVIIFYSRPVALRVRSQSNQAPLGWEWEVHSMNVWPSQNWPKSHVKYTKNSARCGGKRGIQPVLDRCT